MASSGHELVRTVIDEAWQRFRSSAGTNADSITYLAPVDPAKFGVTLVTTGNPGYSVGGDTYSFAPALQTQGADRC